MRIALLHNAVGPEAGPEERDVLVQVEAVAEACRRLGHQVLVVACDLDLGALRERLREQDPDLAFNLVESLGGHDRLLSLVPALLDALGLPYAGCSAAALLATTDKLGAKERLLAAGLPAPACGAVWPPRARPASRGARPAQGHGPRSWILKSAWDHGSKGLEDDCVVREADPAALAARLEQLSPRLGGDCFAEAYIDGRELNLSLLAGPEGPQVLPPAEIDFVDYPRDRPRLVGYRAKWAEGAFEHSHTPRRFDFPAEDEALLAQVTQLAAEAWHLFGLRGWARVDFRVDGAGRPFILEVNANPCLSPDAGFAAALERAGIPFTAAVERILADLPAAAAGAPRGTLASRASTPST